MVESERDQRPLDQPKNERAHISASGYESPQCMDPVLHDRPHKIHGNPYKHIYDGRDDRHKPRPAKKRQCVRQFYFEKPIVKRCHSKPDDDAAKHAHLQRLYPTGRCDRSLQHVTCDAAIRQDFTIYLQHGIDRCIHDQICDHGGKGRYLFLLFCHTDGYSDREDQRQVIKYGASHPVHYDQQGMKQGSFP